MKAIKRNEKTVTITYRDIDIDLSSLRSNPDDKWETDELNMSVRIYEGGGIDVLCDGMMVECGGSGDDDYFDDWHRYHELVLALVGKVKIEDFIECYGNPWSRIQIREMFKDWIKENPEFINDDIKNFVEEEDDEEDNWLFE